AAVAAAQLQDAVAQFGEAGGAGDAAVEVQLTAGDVDVHREAAEGDTGGDGVGAGGSGHLEAAEAEGESAAGGDLVAAAAVDDLLDLEAGKAERLARLAGGVGRVLGEGQRVAANGRLGSEREGVDPVGLEVPGVGRTEACPLELGWGEALFQGLELWPAVRWSARGAAAPRRAGLRPSQVVPRGTEHRKTPRVVVETHRVRRGAQGLLRPVGIPVRTG